MMIRLDLFQQNENILSRRLCTQARVQGGAQGAWAPPPLEIKKQKKKKKKKKKKVIRANIKLFHLYFATFLVENVFFSASFWAGPPPWKSEKQKKKKKKKKGFQILGPPSCEFLDTRLVLVVRKFYNSNNNSNNNKYCNNSDNSNTISVIFRCLDNDIIMPRKEYDSNFGLVVAIKVII